MVLSPGALPYLGLLAERASEAQNILVTLSGTLT